MTQHRATYAGRKLKDVGTPLRVEKVVPLELVFIEWRLFVKLVGLVISQSERRHVIAVIHRCVL